jgi:hypothetical protein
MPYFLQQIGIEMVICKFSLISPSKRSFECETVCNPLLLPDNYSRSGLLGLLHSKVTVWEVEYVAVLVEETGEYLFLETVINFS